MGDEGGVIASHRAGGVEQHRQQVFLDVADFRGVLPHTVHDELNMAAVEFQQLGLYQLGGVVVPGHPDCLSGRADGFHQQFHDAVQFLPADLGVVQEVVVLDILLDDVPVNLNGALRGRFRSFPFRRQSRNSPSRSRGRGRKGGKGMGN